VIIDLESNTMSMLVWIRELTATFLVKVLLRASITVGRRLPERRMMIGHITSLVLLLKTLARSTHACVHQGRPLVGAILVEHRARLLALQSVGTRWLD